MGAARDIIIIGGGHNGLVAAFYLARAGHRPLILERRHAVGGAAISDELHPGYRVPTLSHLTGPLRPSILEDMALARHGLQMLHSETALFAPDRDGRGLVLYRDPLRSAQSLEPLNRRDAGAYADFDSALARIGGALAQLMAAPPPDIDRPAMSDLLSLLAAGRRIRGLGREDLYRVLRWAPMAVADFVGEWFEDELLRAALASRGVFGTFLGPWSAGSAAVFLQRAAADGRGAGTVAFPRGGMGMLTRAMASAAVAAGAEIRTDADVERVEIEGDRATGVVLGNGEALAAKAVVSNADPRRTLLGLVDPSYLSQSFLEKLRNYRCRGTTAKVNMALSGLPAFTALENREPAETRAALSGRIHIGPDIDYIERAFDDAKYGELSKHPYMEITIPSLLDPTLAPEGRHVMSVYLQYAPYHLKKGVWDSRREELGNSVVKTLSEYAPNLEEIILHGEAITPLDLETDYALTGGHIFHGEETIDQIFSMRPVLGWANYRTPIRGLYLCGAGTHPGGGVTGGPGANAAREIARDLGRV